jgi:hypothetical protein
MASRAEPVRRAPGTPARPAAAAPPRPRKPGLGATLAFDAQDDIRAAMERAREAAEQNAAPPPAQPSESPQTPRMPGAAPPSDEWDVEPPAPDASATAAADALFETAEAASKRAAFQKQKKVLSKKRTMIGGLESPGGSVAPDSDDVPTRHWSPPDPHDAQAQDAQAQPPQAQAYPQRTPGTHVKHGTMVGVGPQPIHPAQASGQPTMAGVGPHHAAQAAAVAHGPPPGTHHVPTSHATMMGVGPLAAGVPSSPPAHAYPGAVVAGPPGADPLAATMAAPDGAAPGWPPATGGYPMTASSAAPPSAGMPAPPSMLTTGQPPSGAYGSSMSFPGAQPPGALAPARRGGTATLLLVLVCAVLGAAIVFGVWHFVLR